MTPPSSRAFNGLTMVSLLMAAGATLLPAARGGAAGVTAGRVRALAVVRAMGGLEPWDGIRPCRRHASGLRAAGGVDLSAAPPLGFDGGTAAATGGGR